MNEFFNFSRKIFNIRKLLRNKAPKRVKMRKKNEKNKNKLFKTTFRLSSSHLQENIYIFFFFIKFFKIQIYEKIYKNTWNQPAEEVLFLWYLEKK